MKTHSQWNSLPGLRFGILTLCLLAGAPGMRAETASAATRETLDVFRRPERGLTNYFANAKGYAVFPEITKGGLVFGGAHGAGEVFAGDQLIGRARLTQVTVGAQIGGQVYSEIIFFETAQALEDFKASKLKVSAQVGAVASAESVGQTAKYHQGVAVFTFARQGLMGEASVGGQKFKFEAIAAAPAK